MDFDEAKENIQPLAQGRIPNILQASIRVDSHQELMLQRKELEREIHNYKGDDPLSAWFTYIQWIEQSFPSGGKESGLQQVLGKCLTRFESDERYFQDRRMIRLYIKYIDTVKDPAECYQQLYNAGIGTMVSDFYIAWAYCYDLVNNTRKADEIFHLGIACRAQPFEDLQEAHQHFGFTVSQRIMHKDDDNVREKTSRQLQERRQALSSLRGYRRNQLVGSIRTGAAVKSDLPGTVKNDGPSTSHQRNNARIQVFNEENSCPNVYNLPAEQAATSEDNRSVVRSIIDAHRDQENLKEPGPWNNPHKKGKLFSKTKHINELGFEIHEDEINMTIDDHERSPPGILMTSVESKLIKPIALPPKFFHRNRPQAEWIVPVTTEEKPDPQTLPEYNKCKCYPRPNMEFQPEEYKAYVLFKNRGISNKFTEKRDMYWGRGAHYNLRRYPHFATHANSQNVTNLDEFFVPKKVSGMLHFPFDDIYNAEETVERQYEEILAMRVKRNETIILTTDMEETICAPSEKVQRRKSFYPMRKSIAPCVTNTRGANPKVSLMQEAKQEYEKPSTSSNQSFIPAIFEDRDAIEMPKLLSKINCRSVTEPAVERKNIETPNVLFKQQHTPPMEEPAKTVNTAEVLSIQPLNMGLQKPKIDAETPTPVGFSIFQDESVVAIEQEKPSLSEKGDDFQFKTPALPLNPFSLPVALGKPNKINFEIFEDNTTDSVAVKSDAKCGVASGGFFDADESCSTQTFNIYLRAQSVSTPKPKPEPQRQFGNILREAIPPPSALETKEENLVTTTSPDRGDENSPVAAGTTVFSPQRKQLSTILETSENGTTSTHTTGGSTKSTISSPDFDQELQAQTNAGKSHVPTLDTVREGTLEESLPQSQASSLLEENMSSMRIGNHSKNNNNQPFGLSQPSTPGFVRGQGAIPKHTPESGNSKLSIFEEPLVDMKNAGNFSRLEEREDTAIGFAIKPGCFQEDKTETISKIMLPPSQTWKFQEDKTDTIPAMMLAPPQTNRFQEDKAEDKTENISKLLLPPQHPIQFEDERTETLPHIAVKDTESMRALSEDDLFEFFSQSPPRLGRGATRLNTIDKATFGIIRSAAEIRTPLAKNSKRFCDKNTPEFQKTKPTSVLRDSFMPDFSIVEDSQPKPDSKICKPQSVLRDSFMPDFSLLKDTQSRDLSLIPETQRLTNPESSTRLKQENCARKALQSSYFPDFSYIPETQQPLTTSKEGQPADLKNILTDKFMNDFSEINEPPPMPMDVKEMSMLQPSSKNNSTLKYLEESLSIKSISPKKATDNSISRPTNTNKESKLSFTLANKSGESSKPTGNQQFFELNAETEMFGTNISMIRNSTWLPNHGPTRLSNKHIGQIQENSIHIKDELPSTSSSASSTETQDVFVAPKPVVTDLPRPKLSSLNNVSNKTTSASPFGVYVTQPEFEAINKATKQQQQHSRDTDSSHLKPEDEDDDFGEMSIYYKKTPRTPKAQVHVWDVEDSESCKTPTNNRYTRAEIDLNHTLHVLENVRMAPNVNPFSVDLINAFLEQIQFSNYIMNIPHCMLVGSIHRLKADATIKVNQVGFKVTKLIDEGAYGAVFVGRDMVADKNVALKQEKPANLWEFYICLEIQDRIRIDEMLPAFMSVDYALIGNNCSVLISQYSPYGSLITVCNKIKKHTLKNVDEYVVMVMACELLEIMDHLHAISIIHADIKADNFLVMNKLKYPSKERSLQLIDFGVSIDMKLFRQDQAFSYIHTDNTFNCIEMRENRPWTYQLDLYGLAGVLHVLLFAKYMEVAKKPSGIWMHKTHVPRYFNRELWETIFKALLNIRDCNSMPNLQDLRALLKGEIAEKEKYVIKMVNEFNRALDSAK